MVAIYSQTGRIIIGEYSTEAEVGYFTMATALSTMWLFIPTAIINSFRPTIMEYKEKHQEELYLRRLKQLYSFLIWLSILVSFSMMLLGNFIITTLYGNDYEGAVLPFKIIIWSELFSILGTARGIWILCEKKNKYVKNYLFIGAVFNITLNMIFIPDYGIIAAAIIMLTTQVVTCIIAPLFYKETRIHTKIVLDALLLKW